MENWSLHALNRQLQNNLPPKEAKKWFDYARNLRRQNLPVIFNLRHLSKITNIEQQFLYFSICRFQEKQNYKVFRIKKHSGGYRFIHSPNNNLKKIQYFINKYILSGLKPHYSCFSYHKNGGILKCAQQHTNSTILFKYDLKDFFFCINEIDVYHFFKNLGYTSKLSFQMSRLCTITLIKDYKKYIRKYKIKGKYEKTIELGVLPQGAPTSPMLSNIIAKPLDEKLTKIAKEEDLIYTRYADDLTFSSMKKLTQLEISKINAKILKAIRSERFIPNKQKISICKSGSRKMVLGLLVNGDKPSLSRQKKKKIDTFLYAIKKFGWEKASEHYNFISPLGLAHHISGTITYIQYIDKNLGDNYRERYNQLLLNLFNHSY